MELHGKNGFAERSKILTEDRKIIYRSEHFVEPNNYVECSN